MLGKYGSWLIWLEKYSSWLENLRFCQKLESHAKILRLDRSGCGVPLTGVDPGFEIGGCPKCTRKRAKVFFFSATLTFKSITRFGHLGIVTLSSQLASTSMRWLKIKLN